MCNAVNLNFEFGVFTLIIRISELWWLEFPFLYAPHKHIFECHLENFYWDLVIRIINALLLSCWYNRHWCLVTQRFSNERFSRLKPQTNNILQETSVRRWFLSLTTTVLPCRKQIRNFLIYSKLFLLEPINYSLYFFYNELNKPHSYWIFKATFSN